MNTATKVFKNSLYLFLGYFLGGLILFLLNAAIARYLGASLYGDYSFVIAFISFFIIFANFGLDAVTIRDIAIDSRKVAKLISSSLFLRTILSAIGVVIAIALIYLLPTNEVVQRGVVLISISLFFYSMSLSFVSFFQARLEMFFFFLVEVISKIFYALAVFSVFWFNLGYLALIGCYVLMTLIQFLASYYFVSKRIKIEWKFDKEMSFYLIKESWPLAIMLILASIYYRIDTIMLGFMRSSTEVGYYAAAYTFAGAFTVIPTAVLGSLFPLLSKTWKESKKEFKRIVHFGLKYLVIIGLPIAFSLIIRGEKLVELLYGSDYSLASTAFQILMIATFLIFIISLLDNILVSIGKQKIVMYIVFFTVVLNIGLNLALIPRYGIEGASVATVFSELTNLIIFSTYLRKKIKLDLPELWKIILVVLLSNVFLFARLHILIDLTLTGIFYIVLLYLFKVFREDEKIMIKTALMGSLKFR